MTLNLILFDATFYEGIHNNYDIYDAYEIYDIHVLFLSFFLKSHILPPLSFSLPSCK